MIVHCRLKEVLNERGMEQKELAEKTGIREATISELCRNRNKMFSRDVLNRIIKALDIKDINEIITLVDEKDPQA